MLGVHLLAAGILWTTVLPMGGKLALAAAILVSLIHTLFRLIRPEIVSLDLRREGQIEVCGKVGAGETAVVLPQTTVVPGVIVLVFRLRGKLRSLVLLPDSIDIHAHRQLRIWLKWRAAAA